MLPRKPQPSANDRLRHLLRRLGFFGFLASLALGAIAGAWLGAHPKTSLAMRRGFRGMDDALYRRRELVEGIALFFKIFVPIINTADARHDVPQPTLGIVRRHTRSVHE